VQVIRNAWVGGSSPLSGTIFGLLRMPIAALNFAARRSRTRLYCSRHRCKIRLVLGLLATAERYKYFWRCPDFGSCFRLPDLSGLNFGVVQAQRVADHRDRTETHRRRGKHRRQQQAEHWIQHAGRNRYAERVGEYRGQ